MTMQMVVLTAYAYLYGRLYLSLIGLKQSIIRFARTKGETALKLEGSHGFRICSSTGTSNGFAHDHGDWTGERI